MTSDAPKILIIVASTRTNRFADAPLAWALDRLGKRDDLSIDVLDLREHPLPFYDAPKSPGMAHREYHSPEQELVGGMLDRADAFIIITNEYNHSYSGALKNMLDHFFVELRRKPVSFVGYGNVGGARAIEQLRLVVTELEMMPARHAVHILGAQVLPIMKGEAPALEVLSALDERLTIAVTDLLWWTRALNAARATA